MLYYILEFPFSFVKAVFVVATVIIVVSECNNILDKESNTNFS